ncbi:sulfatase-like hydrolase/transferase [Stieleria marina]|uniref:sulfatase-like hydrolase/transferase n=1 Tax=Stieleria marina TaxID=1930275 RepID=UPI003AF40623
MILIVFDDLFDLVDERNSHGPEIHSPNFDRLAAKAVRFENAFASIAVCNASRSSFLTGQSPFRTTIHVPEPVQWNEVLPPEASFVSNMKEAGYRSLSSGKVFHNQTRPNEQAYYDQLFDQNFQHPTQLRLALPPGEIASVSEERQADGVHVDWAIEKISQYERTRDKNTDQFRHDDPMFLSVGIIRPHRPFIAPQAFFDLYPIESINTITSLASDEADLDDVSEFYKTFRLQSNYHKRLVSLGQAAEFTQGYLACLSYADSLLGKLLDAIEANDHLSDALIIITSDNGYQLGEKSTWNKFTLWEDSAKVPLYVADPRLAPGTQCDVPVSLLDIAPTICSVGNATPSPLFDGQDLVEIALNPDDHKARVAITSMIGSLSVRSKQYRLKLYNDGSTELYDVIADPREVTNLIPLGSHQAVAEQLVAQIGSVIVQQGGVVLPGASTIGGTEADDTIFVIGNQVAAGGAGDDVYFVADGGSISENEGGGYDTAVYADFDVKIPNGVEYVRTTLYSNNRVFDVEGNEESNRVFITSARANISGMAGNDVLFSGNARDILDGGSGNDVIWTTGGFRNLIIGGHGLDVIVGAEKRDVIFGGLSDSQIQSGEVPDMQGDFVLSGDIYVLTATDAFLPTGQYVRNGALTELTIDDLPFVRHSGKYFAFGQELKVDGPTQEVFLDLPQVDAALRNITSGDLFLIAEGDGDDVSCGDGNDVVFTQSGNDLIRLGGGRNYVQSLGGDDTIRGGIGNDQIWSGEGDDDVNGGLGDNRVIAGPGSDKVLTRGGEDWIDAGSEDDEVTSGAGDDLILGRDGDDMIRCQGGNDICFGGDGSDVIRGGTGNDVLHGNASDDILFGQGGQDECSGGRGNDWIEGGAGNDVLVGHSGDDNLLGGPGADRMTGGIGRDRFWFSRFFGHNEIMDFNRFDDRIVFAAGSTLHRLNDTDVVTRHCSFDGQHTTISDANRQLIVRDTEPNDLLGRFDRQ